MNDQSNHNTIHVCRFFLPAGRDGYDDLDNILKDRLDKLGLHVYIVRMTNFNVVIFESAEDMNLFKMSGYIKKLGESDLKYYIHDYDGIPRWKLI